MLDISMIEVSEAYLLEPIMFLPGLPVDSGSKFQAGVHFRGKEGAEARKRLCRVCIGDGGGEVGLLFLALGNTVNYTI